MRRINDFAELAPLLSANLKPGVTVNTSVTADEYKREFEDANVFVKQTDGALLIFLSRDGYYKLNFFLQRGSVLPRITADMPVVTEYATRTGANLDIQNGRLLFSRMRLKRMPAPVQDGISKVRLASDTDFDDCKRIMTDNFHRFAGCIPTDSQLLRDIRDGLIYFSDDGGILHTRHVHSAVEIRHLAVDLHARKKGVAQSMFHAFMEDNSDLPCRVWVITDNLPAVRFYEKNGFKPDGITTKVYIFGEKK